MASYNRSPLENLRHNQEARRQTGRAARRQEARVLGRPMAPPTVRVDAPEGAQVRLTYDYEADPHHYMRVLNFGGFDPSSQEGERTGVIRAYVDGVEVPLEQAHDLPRDGRAHHVAITRTGGRRPVTTERWERVMPDGTIYRNDQIDPAAMPQGSAPETPPTRTGMFVHTDFSALEARILAMQDSRRNVEAGQHAQYMAAYGASPATISRSLREGVRNYPIQGSAESLYRSFEQLGLSGAVTAEALMTSLRQISAAFSIEIPARRMTGNPDSPRRQAQEGYGMPAWMNADLIYAGNVPDLTIKKEPPKPHPDAGKVVRRPRRSVGGIMVEDYIADDGRVARRPRTDTPK